MIRRCHIWQEVAAHEKSSPLRTRPGFEEAVTVELLIAAMDEAAADGALVVTPGIYRGDNSYSVESANTHRDRLAVVATIRIRNHDFEEPLSQWQHDPAIVGGRIVLRSDRDVERLRGNGYRRDVRK